MTKKYMKARGRKGPDFIMLRYDMIDSAAWQSLPASAQALWCHIRRRYNGYNNGEIPLSCREAALLLNVSKNSAGKMFEILINRGFIDIGEHSNFTLKIKRSRRWIFTHEVYEGKSPTNKWRTWNPDAEADKA